MIEKIEDKGELLAIILRNNYSKEGLNFLTSEDHSFQVAFHNVEKGKRYKAHKSKPISKIENFKTNKIYLIKEGKTGIDIYNKKDEKISYKTLQAGDLILFFEGGHGLDILENSKIIEIKQGPYRGTKEDKEFLE